MLALLKKHYEKIILAVILLIFIASLLWLILVLGKSLDIDIDDVKLPKISSDYKGIDTETLDYDLLLEKEKAWIKLHDGDAEKEKEKEKDQIDFMIPYKGRRCPECVRIIPLSAFYDGRCPSCNAKLKPPGIKEEIKGLDTDRDGIPDVDETALGLDINNPMDAFDDMDKDMFSNLVEFKFGTKINDPASQPPLAIRLYVSKIMRRILPLILVKIVQKGDDKSKWEIQIEETISGKKRLNFYKIGDTIKSENYKINDIIPKEKQVFDKKLKQNIMVDGTQVIIQTEGDAPIEVSQKAKVTENKEKISIVDSANAKEYLTAVKGTFQVDRVSLGTEVFTVVEILDAGKKRVKLKTKDGMDCEIKDKSVIATMELEKREIEPVKPASGPEGMEFMPPMPEQPIQLPPLPTPSRRRR